MCVGHERIEWIYRMFHHNVGIWPFWSWVIFYGIWWDGHDGVCVFIYLVGGESSL